MYRSHRKNDKLQHNKKYNITEVTKLLLHRDSGSTLSLNAFWRQSRISQAELELPLFQSQSASSS